jgi:hypothetical protein
MDPIRSYLAAIGAKGGRKSRRDLAPEVARDMVRVREARRACFWSYRPDLEITLADIPWVAEQLRKNGNRETWLLAERLCR